ncbi:hypothetical protein CR513_46471, partial [Mucuna pruriens]
MADTIEGKDNTQEGGLNSSEVNEKLQKEVIDLRQSLAKFVNGFGNLKKVMKRKKKIKRDKLNAHCLNCRKFRHLSYDCRERPKELSKPSRTNKRGPNRIWVPKNMIVPMANLCDNKKETPIMKGLCPKTSDPRQEDGLPLEAIKKYDLLSISKLYDSGYDVSFNKEECINNLYKINLIDLTNQNVTCLVSINDD